MVTPPGAVAESKGTLGGGSHALPSADIHVGALAWIQNEDYGFSTVNVSYVDSSTRRAFVEVHPEDARSAAAAEAAALVVREATSRVITPTTVAADPSVGGDGMLGQHHNPSHLCTSQSGDTGRHERQSVSYVLKSKNSAEEPGFDYEVPNTDQEQTQHVLAQECTDPRVTGPQAVDADTPQRFSSEKVPNFLSPSCSAAQIERQAADAAETAAAHVSSSFISKPPFEVPVNQLWPYSAPPLPPHPMPDDTACCGTLSAAALLQLLQHRYLRDDIYTYAANVLLAMNPYKPLPHLYSTQQVSLYRHWREVARIYRRQLNEDQSSSAGEPPRQTDATTAISSLLDNLPGVLPICRRPSFNAGDFLGPKESPELNPLMKHTKHSANGPVGAPDPPSLVAAMERAFRETTASRNRPPPHPFVVAEEALRRLVGTQTSQTIVVSGQSGAGKTETSKQLMLFLTHVSTSPHDTLGVSSDGAARSSSNTDAPKTVSGQRTEVAALLGGVQTLQEATELQKRIVSCNAIFESFGNAATRRNHNSSRIGRLTLLHFDGGGLLRGGSLRTYLLEASRITAHKRGDRNFHVFYQLLRGTADDLRRSMRLSNDEEAYRILRPVETHNFLQKLFSKEQHAARRSEVDAVESNVQVPPDVDQENFELMMKGFELAEFSAGEITELLHLLAGLLHLSNVSFMKDEDDILQLEDTASHEALNNASLLLGLQDEKLKVLLQCRCMHLKGDALFTHRNEQQSACARSSLIKFIYSRLFDHIVNRLNDSVAQHLANPEPQEGGSIPASKTIGILDIYGFESFGLENGLEQLCINYANEKQQQLFVQQVIEEEVALYTREGVTSPAVAARNKASHQRSNAEQETEQHLTSEKAKPPGSFKADLELSLLSSLPDTSALLRDLQEGVFRRLDDSCRLLAQGQARDDTHFWNGLFTYCASTQQSIQPHKPLHLMQRSSNPANNARDQHILFCLKGTNGMQAAEAAASGALLQHLQQEYLTSIGLVGAQQLQARKGGGGVMGGTSAAGKVQERVFAVKHFAGTVMYGTDGWLELNNDRIEHELEHLVATSTKPFLRQAMQQHDQNQKQDGISAPAAGGGQFSSITKRFLKSVKDLTQELQGPHMQLHFIRCFIPNCGMKPDKFERKVVLHQLQHSGSLALVDILQSGFPHRMPLRALASRLRKVLGPLIAERLKEQEEKMKKLSTNVNLQQEDVSRESRVLETLRHCNPVTVRDRTLVSATLGLLPQSHPGSFICGVSLVCFKAAVYGEAAALMADPGNFFKTPEDVCRLITAIQRLRWRVAVRIILHVHPALQWLQRRAFLMRRIKEAAVTAAVRILLLRKHVLKPLRESVQRRISIRHALRTLELILLRRGLQTWRKCSQVIVATAAAKPLPPRQKPIEDKIPPKTASLSGAETPSGRNEGTRATEGEECQSHPGIPVWNARLFLQNDLGKEALAKEGRVTLFPGRDLYLVHYDGADESGSDVLAAQQDSKQRPVQIEKLPVLPSLMQKEDTHHSDLFSGHIFGGEGKVASAPHETSSGTPLVTIAKHPSYTSIYVACTAAAQLLLLSTSLTADSGMEESYAAEDKTEEPLKCGTKLYGEPSTSLPCLAFPSSISSSLASPQSLHSGDTSDSSGSTKICCTMEKPSPSSFALPRTLSKELPFPKKYLSSNPIPPGKWLPRDLLDQVTRALQQHADAGQARPPTVRPLSISFANPLTADYAIVVCLVQGGSKQSTNNKSSSMGKLIVVLVDLLRRSPAGWIPLFFASHDISICARRNCAFLQQLSEATISGHTEHSSSASEEHQSSRSQRPAARSRSRSTMLSTVRLQPLWGNLWAVTGPSLLAVFSVNLRFLHHPPAEVEGQIGTRDPPLRLLWNMPSIPRVNGMTLELADVWLTGCTYTRLAPPHLSSVIGTDPIIQALQMMPFGEVARSLEAKMQRLLLLSAADNSLLLLQWRESGSDLITGSGNLVLLDQTRLPFPVLQFLRQEPEAPLMADCQGNNIRERTCRVLRAFPWEGDLLVSKAALDDQDSKGIDCSDSTTASSRSSKSWSSQVQRYGLQRHTCNKAKGRSVGSLIRDFPSYGIAIVLTNGRGILHALDDQFAQQQQRDTCLQRSQILAVSTSPAFSGLVISLRRCRDGHLRICLEDNEGSVHFSGEIDLQDPPGSESICQGSRIHIGSS